MMIIRMPVKVVHVPSVGEITLIQNPRSRRIRLRVRPGRKVSVSFPLHVNCSEAVRFATLNATWIAQQHLKIETKMPLFSEESVFRTRLHRITFLKAGDSFILKKENSEFRLFIPSGHDFKETVTREKICKVITEIYRLEAKTILPPRIAFLAGKTGLRYNKLSIRNNKTNWGSCSAGSHISLNLNLMKLPDYLVDYVILHELAHTKVRNHGPAFWKLLDELTGNCGRKLAAELRKFSSSSW